MSILKNLNGFYIFVVPDTKRQNRTHKRKRINKKWAKRYGFSTYNTLDDGKIVQSVLDKTLYMNPRTYDDLRVGLKEVK